MGQATGGGHGHGPGDGVQPQGDRAKDCGRPIGRSVLTLAPKFPLWWASMSAWAVPLRQGATACNLQVG